MKAIILAAGQGTRMKSSKPKVLHEIFKKPMIQYVIDAAQTANSTKIVVVVGHKSDEVISSVGDDITCVLQQEQLGTGHAVKVASEHIGNSGQILILYGDTPIITPKTIKALQQEHIKNKNDVTILSAHLSDPTGYGRVIQKNGYVKIVEERDTNDEEKAVTLANVGIYLFEAKALNLALDLLKNENNQKEYYLTDTLEILVHKNYKAGVMVADDFNEFLGVNTRGQLAFATSIIQKRTNEHHMEMGVTIVDPRTTYIGSDVTIGTDTIVYPGTILTGNTTIGKDCIVGANCDLHNAKLGDFVQISSTVATDCTIGAHSFVGPFAYIRPNSIIGEKCKVGNFVEIKNSTLGNNTKASHLTYIGDSIAGNNVNFGCGAVTVNYDGLNKHKTIIKDDAFIGCNANLVAPLTIEEKAFVAAGSTITGNIPANALGVARPRQINIKNWRASKKT
jgi:bifunctional UDP-N-acetylglucosamine pyrophosphorylase / glucosamine-1-phosphate N-acetyltransferase